MTKTKPSNECVEFSKKHFQEYINNLKYFDQISKIMTLLIFKGDKNSMIYQEYDEELLWKK